MSNQITTINPSNGQQINSYTLQTKAEVKESIEKCHQAFLNWKATSIEERSDIINSIGKKLKENEDSLSDLMTTEMGKLLKHSKQEINLCAGICEWTAKNGAAEFEDEERDLPDGGKGIISYLPIGVIYGIQPWNFPLYQVIRYSIASLMAGNGVLLKHASNVSGTGLRIQEIFEDAGLPKDLFTVLLIDHDISDEVIKNDLVRGVTLTGSPSAGKIIAEKAGAALKKTVMELGSNDAYIVLEDADLEVAIRSCVAGRTYNNGETCVAAKRFIVVEEVYDEFKKGFVAKMESLKYGDPKSKDSKLGPMAREDLREDLHEQVLKSVEKGAKVLCGGEIPDGEGFYYPATVLENVKKGQPAYDDELFGPVASLIKVKDEKEAMKVANDSKYGLGGGIFTKDQNRAIELAKHHFDTGMVYINGFGLAVPNMPFGGVKESGYGREHGGFGMKEFVNVKAIQVKG